MLAYIPVRFDLYRTVRPTLRWTLQCLVGFADRGGRCFPSIRKLAEVTGISKSTVARHLTELVEASAITRWHRPGGGFTYQVDARFLPAARGVSHQRDRAVPPARTEEKEKEEKVVKKTTGSLRDSGFAAALRDDLPATAPWKQRLQGWERSRFWLPQWGPRPNEAGCWAPVV